MRHEATIAVCLLSLAAWGAPLRAQERQPVAGTPSGGSSQWLERVSEEIRTGEYRFGPVRDEAGVWSAPNRSQGLRTRVAADGIEVFPRAVSAQGKGAPWKLALGTRAFGRVGDVGDVQQGALWVNGSRVELDRGALVEWFENGEEGIEQGWTIASRPGGLDPLRIVLAIEGLSLRIDSSGRSGVFVDARGTKRLAYQDLLAWDALGTELKARLVPDPGGASIQVEDGGAVYPITVDPLLTDPAWTAGPDQAGSFFGWSVSAAGDVNGDGYSDVIVGATMYDNGEVDEGRAFVYHGSATGLGASAAWTAEPDQASANFGASVSSAGDVNGDGYSDVIVGAPLYDDGQVNEGGAFLYHGSAGGLSLDPGWTQGSDQSHALFGQSVSTAGDVNGDGYSDVVVGAVFYSNGEVDEGRAFVYHGSATGLSTSAAWTAESNRTNGQFGVSASTAGDVNGDGYADVIVGAFIYENGETAEGRAYVYHGSSGGLLAGAAWTRESNQALAHFGRSVSTAGDVNGDGYSDVIVGAPLYDGGQDDEGRVYVYLGSAAGLSTSAAWTKESDQVEAKLGRSVSTAGDVNGDGYSDVIVGAPFFDNGETDEGRAFVYLGSPNGLSTSAIWTAEADQIDASFGFSVSSAGDVNGDGYSDLLVGAPLFVEGMISGRVFAYHGSAEGLAEDPEWTAEPGQMGAEFGYSVSTAGDVDGDGYSDVIVGAPFYDNGETAEGRSFVYLGSGAGLATTAAWTAESNQSGALFGCSVSTAGDVNGDGYSDVVVGAYGYNNPSPDEGRAFVYLGSAGGLGTSAAWTAEGNQSMAFFGWSVSSAGDVNGDGYSDVIVGAYAHNNGEADEGRAYVYHGASSGLSAAAAWTAESNQANARFGDAVSTAGDVNGDGYSDVIVGAYYYGNGDLREGRAFTYHGSAKGLGSTAAWTVESNQFNGFLGKSVSTAGDVNGDGYSDVIVGAYGYDNGEANEGRALVYHGSPSGLLTTAAWTTESNLAGAWLGWSVSTAGDVDGDGYSDVIVGARLWESSLCHEDEGAVFVYLGSASGVMSSHSWSAEADQTDAEFGHSVSTAGDVNGDGYGDVVIGGHLYEQVETDEGRAFVYLGNMGRGGWMSGLQQRRIDGITPIDLLGSSNHHQAFRPFATFERDLAGFSWATPLPPEIALEWAVEVLGSLYGGVHVYTGTSQVYTGSPLSLSGHAGGLTPGRAYLWKARLRTNNPLLPVTPWVSVPGNGPTEWTLRTKPVGGTGKDPDGPL